MQSLFGVVLAFAFACFSNGKVTEKVNSAISLKSDDASHSSKVEMTLAVSTELQRLGFTKHLVLDSSVDEEGQRLDKRTYRFHKRVTAQNLLDIVRKIAAKLPQVIDAEEVDYVRQILQGEKVTEVDINEVEAIQIEFGEDHSQGTEDDESDDKETDDDSTTKQGKRKKRLVPAIILIGLMLLISHNAY